MRTHWQNWGSVLLLAGLLAIVVFAVWTKSNMGQLDKRTRRAAVSIDNCSPDEQTKYTLTSKNQSLLSREVSTYAEANKAFPDSYASLNASIFASIRPVDIVNPFNNQPVQDSTTPSPGNMTWIYAAPTAVVTFYYLCNAALESEAVTWDATDLVDLQQSGLTVDTGLSSNAQIAYFGCDLVADFVWDYKIAHAALPPDFSALATEFPEVNKIRNEFTGGYAQNVPESSPSAGNFTYALKVDSDAQNYGSVACYGDQGGQITNKTIP